MKNLHLVLASLLLVFAASCSKDDVASDPNPETSAEMLSDKYGEQAFFGKTGITKKGNYLGTDVTYNLIEGQAVFEGDIILSKEDLGRTSADFVTEVDLSDLPETSPDTPVMQSVGRKTRRWPNSTVPYAISQNFPNQQRIFNAIKEWEAKTNIRFVKRTNQRDYVLFVRGGGCSSSVGRSGGAQYVNLADGCGTGATIHELGHAIGLWHEQSRVDRDKYIKIHYQNIQRGMEYNFDNYLNNYGEGKEYTRSLDFNSIMMYSAYSFSKNGRPTITKADGSMYRTQRSGLSEGDISGVRQMYPGKGNGGGTGDGGNGNGGETGGGDGDGDGGGQTGGYQNGQYYVIDKLRVYRSRNKWWYYRKGRWNEVVNIQGRWYIPIK